MAGVPWLDMVSVRLPMYHKYISLIDKDLLLG